MTLSEFLEAEWCPALGCTEPAAIAYAAATAAGQARGPIRRVALVCDPRIYKNCYAVGIPGTDRRSGILWALGLGALLPDPSYKLECFRLVTADIVAGAKRLIDAGALAVEVDRGRMQLYIDVTVERESGSGRAVIEMEHTRLMRVERDGRTIFEAAAGFEDKTADARLYAASLSFSEAIAVARSAAPSDREFLRRSANDNIAICEHGLSLMPPGFLSPLETDALTRIGRLVAAGVHARMCGEEMIVMSLAGSGNKGITASVPVALWGRHLGVPIDRLDEALALSCLVTSGVTQQLGALSAMCGAAIAGGIGVACAIVYLEGGGPDEMSSATTNIVGNLAGIICDGAKIGCSLKTMTGVDAAFRAASLALAGVTIPHTDGIVGRDGASSLGNLGRLAKRGMMRIDDEILDIMQSKLRCTACSTED